MTSRQVSDFPIILNDRKPPYIATFLPAHPVGRTGSPSCHNVKRYSKTRARCFLVSAYNPHSSCTLKMLPPSLPAHLFNMPAVSWASKEQQVWLTDYQQTHYVPLMAKRNYSGFWNPFYEAFAAQWPEHERLFPGMDNDSLTPKQKEELATAIQDRKTVSNFFNDTSVRCH